VLEDSLSGIEGVELMTSQSRSEQSRINVRFRLSRDPDSAGGGRRDKVARVRAKLPDTVDEPVIAKVERIRSRSSMSASKAKPGTAIAATDYINPLHQAAAVVLPGRADVRVFGERAITMRLEINRTRLAGTG
jgi:multidrug efflux pump